MSTKGKGQYPSTGLAGKFSGKSFDEAMESKPASEREVTPPVSEETSKIRQLLDKPEDPKGEIESEVKGKRTRTAKTEKKPKTQTVLTYFSDENYDEFEDMSHEIKRHVRQKTDRKLKDTNIAEIAIMIAIEEFKANPEKIYKRIMKILENY